MNTALLLALLAAAPAEAPRPRPTGDVPHVWRVINVEDEDRYSVCVWAVVTGPRDRHEYGRYNHREYAERVADELTRKGYGPYWYRLRGPVDVPVVPVPIAEQRRWWQEYLAKQRKGDR